MRLQYKNDTFNIIIHDYFTNMVCAILFLYKFIFIANSEGKQLVQNPWSHAKGRFTSFAHNSSSFSWFLHKTHLQRCRILQWKRETLQSSTSMSIFSFINSNVERLRWGWICEMHRNEKIFFILRFLWLKA